MSLLACRLWHNDKGRGCICTLSQAFMMARWITVSPHTPSSTVSVTAFAVRITGSAHIHKPYIPPTDIQETGVAYKLATSRQ